MSARRRSHDSPSSRVKSGTGRCRRSSPRGDWGRAETPTNTGYAEHRDYSTFYSPSDIGFKTSDEQSESNCSISHYGDLVSPDDENGETEDNFGDPRQERERLVRNVTYSSHPIGKGVPIYATDDYEDVSLRRDYLYAKEKSRVAYEPIYDPRATSAAQKLQRLRELQRRRDYTERFYSHEIRKLIGDHYVETKPSAFNRAQNKVYGSSYVGDRLTPKVVDGLEPCGTMTTVTRLNCGCVEQTTRPIFTTSSGQQVQRRNCAQDQQVHVRMSAPNARLVVGGNHHQSTTTAGPTNSSGGTRLRSRSFAHEQRPASPSPAPTKQTPDQQKGTLSARKASELSLFSA